MQHQIQQKYNYAFRQQSTFQTFNLKAPSAHLYPVSCRFYQLPGSIFRNHITEINIPEMNPACGFRPGLGLHRSKSVNNTVCCKAPGNINNRVNGTRELPKTLNTKMNLFYVRRFGLIFAFVVNNPKSDNWHMIYSSVGVSHDNIFCN